ncbi:hypothetical protein BV22DRAFT_985626, partial [Leucogyrophana mollusca]
CVEAGHLRSMAWDRRVIQAGLVERFRLDTICGLQALMDIEWDRQEGWCSPCVAMWREAWGKTRESLWAELD